MHAHARLSVPPDIWYRTLAASGVGNGDLLQLARQQPAGQSGASQRPSYNAEGYVIDPQAAMQQLLSNPAALATLPPQLVDAIRSGNVQRFQVDNTTSGCFQW